MKVFEILLLLLGVSGVLQIVARRINVPHPVLLVIGGALVAFFPIVPRVSINPELLFVIFIPPLLYVAAVRTSLREFTAALGPILRLGVFLVLATIAAVAATSHALAPELTWGAAYVLGAIVAPPDPVAATAVMRPLGAPPALVSIIEGEGLVNDATALVAYRMAVTATLTGTFSLAHATVSLLLTGGGGVLFGLAAGWTIVHIRGSALRDLPVVDNTLSILTPFITYIPANALGASGVLAVVTAGIYIGRQTQRIGSAATRVQSEAMWSMITFCLESPSSSSWASTCAMPSGRCTATPWHSSSGRRWQSAASSSPCAWPGSGRARILRGSSAAARCPTGDGCSSSAGPACAAPTRWSSPWPCRWRFRPAT
jgi:CPA1 family monovalent cation:H+ antiporter